MSRPDLKTHAGRVVAIRRVRKNLGDALAEAVEKHRAHDPFPAVFIETGGSDRVIAAVCDRTSVLNRIGRKENSPELWALLTSDSHPPETVFYVLFHERRHSFARTRQIPKGLQDN